MWSLIAAITAAALPIQPAQDDVPNFWVRPGYKVTIAAEQPGTRFLEFDDKGTLFISRPNPGEIRAFVDKDKDGLYETSTAFVTGKPTVHGMAFEGGWLWYSQSGEVHKARDTNNDGIADEDITVIKDLPNGGGHWWRALEVTADAIYTGIGDAANASDMRATDRQKIWKFAKDGTGKTLVAGGLRNTEKLRMRPGTTDLWGVDHGSDKFGDPYGETPGNTPISNLNPTDEFNLYTGGKFYGHPFIMGYGVPRPEFKDVPDLLKIAAETITPGWNFPAHSASNSFCFVAKKTHFPADHYADAFIAHHGNSGGTTLRAGYSVDRLLFDKETGKPYGLLPIVKCLDKDNKPLGRPLDCTEAPDGSILFADDAAGVVYRISYTGAKK